METVKERRVILTLEVTTDAPFDVLRRAASYSLEVLSKGAPYEVDVLQAQANVPKATARKTKARKK